MVKVLTNCEDGALTIIRRPKRRVSLKSVHGILYVRRSRLALVRTCIVVLVDQPSLQTSRFSLLLLEHNDSVLPWFVGN